MQKIEAEASGGGRCRRPQLRPPVPVVPFSVAVQRRACCRG